MDGPASDTTLADALASWTRTRGHRPLLTAYDDVTGARTELSYATADNWAAKTAHLLREDLGVQPATTVALDLDGHWTAVVFALACWKLGAAVAGRGVDTDAAVTCCHASRLGDDAGAGTVVVGDGLRAEPVHPLPLRDGVVLLADDVHAFADEYDSADVEPSSPALVTPATRHDHASLRRAATRWRGHLGDGARVGVAAPLDGADALEVLSAVVLTGSSLVATRPGTGPVPWERWAAERVTVAIVPTDAAAFAPPGMDVVPHVPQARTAQR